MKTFSLLSSSCAFIDLRKIGDPALIDSVNETAYRAYNHAQMIAVEHDSAQVLISESGVIDGNRYLDPRKKMAVTVDHVKQSVVSAEPTEVGGTNETLRASIDISLQKYVAGTFPSAGSAVYPDLTICISSGLFAPAKFWNGRWCSVWKYAGGKLTGTVKVCHLCTF